MAVLTSRCNLACPHCYEGRREGAVELDTREWLAVLDALAETGALILVASGGEPLLRSDLFDILEGAGERRFAVTLKTNGTLLTEERARRCWDLGVSKLDISLYHSVADKHDAFVGRRGSFDRSTEALRAFRALGGKVRASVVTMNWNAEDIPRLMDRCEREGWKYGVDLRVCVTVEGDRAPAAYRASADQIHRLLMDRRLSNPIVDHEALPPAPDDELCGAGSKSVTIRPDGEVWPCNLLPMSMGNVRQTPYPVILREATGRRAFSFGRWGDSEKCGGCELSFACTRCPGNAFLEHGDSAAPSDIDCMLAGVRADIVNQRRGDRKG